MVLILFSISLTFWNIGLRVNNAHFGFNLPIINTQYVS